MPDPSTARPAALPENRRVWFAGARPAAALVASGRTAATWRDAAPDWARPYVDASDWPAPPDEPGRWVIDFAPACDAATAARAGRAWVRFQAAGARLPRTGEAAELRIALAKCARVLVAPARGRHRDDWHWLDARTLPGRGLVVLARDDEFIAAVARSRWLGLWERLAGGAPRLACLRSFPLPWPAETPRSALTRHHEDARDAVLRAARGSGADELDHAVALAYGWPGSIDEIAAGEALRTRHAARLALTAPERAAGT